MVLLQLLVGYTGEVCIDYWGEYVQSQAISRAINDTRTSYLLPVNDECFLSSDVKMPSSGVGCGD
jgi:hypothetical protein